MADAVSADLALASRLRPFMPPVVSDLFPASLLERFSGNAEEALMRLLVFLSPITVRPIDLPEGR